MKRVLSRFKYRKIFCGILLTAGLLSAAACNLTDKENVPVQNMSRQDVVSRFAEAVFVKDDAELASGYASAELNNSLISITEACDPLKEQTPEITVVPQREDDSQAEFKASVKNFAFNGRKGAEAELTVGVLKKNNLIVRSSCKIKLNDGTTIYI